MTASVAPLSTPRFLFLGALAKYEEFVQRGGNDPEVTDAILEIKKELEKSGK